MKSEMSTRQFHKRTFTVEVLSEEEIPSGMSTEEILFEAKEGSYSLRELNEKDTVINAKQAAKLLLKQGSEPSFFKLTPQGADLE